MAADSGDGKESDSTYESSLSQEQQLWIAQTLCIGFALIAVGYLWGITVSMMVLDKHAMPPNGWPSVLYNDIKHTGYLVFGGGLACSVIALYIQRRT